MTVSRENRRQAVCIYTATSAVVQHEACVPQFACSEEQCCRNLFLGHLMKADLLLQERRSLVTP